MSQPISLLFGVGREISSLPNNESAYLFDRVSSNALVLHFIITVTYSYARNIPRLSKAGMPSRSEGWGGAEREPDRAKH